eukprot:CAMPEP_0118670816 /NCGR_PEP_ID=MMETSP0785-20121206/21664_1 /TAXON_ID=91992 /ORGANISM="Bolidomonas pacifica, Strain CCMP 1866" /LENGTH=49 /DNA_ID=CAMNT_0006565647 /DNA_START=399 /DNA_END=548 /DNA_ORIENTATION=-
MKSVNNHSTNNDESKILGKDLVCPDFQRQASKLNPKKDKPQASAAEMIG